jgi:phospholipase C
VCGTPNTGATLGRCGHGPRLPLILISPFANPNYVDHTLTDQASIIGFIEYNWNTGYIDGPTAPTPIQNASFDRYAGTLLNMLSFNNGNPSPLFLSCQGSLVATYAQSCQVDPNP